MPKKFFISLFSILNALFFILYSPPSALAVWDPTQPDQPAEIKDLEKIFSNVLSIIAALAALACFIMLIVGGFKYLASGGDPKATTGAKNTITYAIIGLAALIIAWLILLLIKEVTGIDVTIFRIQYNLP